MGSQTPKQWNWLKKVLTNSIVLLIADYSALVHPDYIEVDLWSIDGLDFTSRKRRLGEKSEVEEEGAVGLEEQELESALPSPFLRGKNSIAARLESPQQRERQRREVAVQELKFELAILTKCNRACQTDTLSALGTAPSALINDYFQAAVASEAFTLLLEREGKAMGLFADGFPTASNGVLTYVHAAKSILNDDGDFSWPPSHPTDATDQEVSEEVSRVKEWYYPDLDLGMCKFDGLQGNTLDLYSSLHECCLFPWMLDYGRCISNSDKAHV